MNDLLIIRILFILLLACAGYYLRPFGLQGLPWVAAAAGAGLGAAIVFFEIRLKRVSLKRLIGAAIGSILGIVGAYLTSLVLGETGRVLGGDNRSIQATFEFLQLGILLWMAYIGLVVGAKRATCSTWRP